MSHFLDAWVKITGKDVRSLKVINLEELTRLRNTLIHDGTEATQKEAEFLLYCLHVILETFELVEEDLPESRFSAKGAEELPPVAENRDAVGEKLPLTSGLRQSIVQFLMSLPNIQDHAMQRALVDGAGLDPELLHQIRFSEPVRQFVELLVSTSSQYGRLNNGQTALEAILVAAKTYVGQDKRAICNRLIQELHANVSAGTPQVQQHPIDQEITLHAEQPHPTSSLNIPLELSQALKRQEVVLFIGSDLSAYAGLPSLLEIIRPLAHALQQRWPADERDVTPEHLMRTAQHYENQQGRHALITHLRHLLENPGIHSSSLHRLIATLPLKLIFTTAYDELLQRTLQQAGIAHDVMIEESDIPFGSEQRLQLIKLCGDVRHPQSIVITQHDFNTYLTTHSMFVGRLRNTLERQTPLFLGYNLQDPFFNQIWDTISLEFGNYGGGVMWCYSMMLP